MTVAESEPVSSGPTSGHMTSLDGTKLSVGDLPADLTDGERGAVGLFLAHVNGWRTARGFGSVTARSAVKFLMARKFNLNRALKLYQQHEIMRAREGLDLIDLESCGLKRELETGKFTVLPTRDPHGAALALFNAKLHDPSSTTHKTTLQGVIHQLDVAMEDTRTQRGGLVFVYNMDGSKYSNFDKDLSLKMLTLLKGCYPARLKKVLIVTAPLWFKAPFEILRLFVREKLRDRVHSVSIPQIQILHVPAASLPKELGGSLVHDHRAWLNRCRQVAESRNGQLVTLSCSQPNSPVRSHPQLANRPTVEQLGSFPVVDNSSDGNGPSPGPNGPNNGASAVMGQSEGYPPPPEDENECHGTHEPPGEILHVNGNESSAESISDDDELDPEVGQGHNIEDFIEHVRLKGRNGLYDEYGEIRSRPPIGTFINFKFPQNKDRNRYSDVPCLDQTRVLLRDLEDGETDYINANYVDGFRQKSAFIFTQGPLKRTFKHFWQMVWEQRVQVIVMATKTFERGRDKCGQYWPNDAGAVSPEAGHFKVSNVECTANEDYVVSRLRVANEKTGKSRDVVHFQFISWWDMGVPDSALPTLTFLQKVRETQAAMTSQLERWEGHSLGPPIVVHCSAGIGRTGTFATLDIAIRKFEAERKVDIRSTIEHIRSQRAYSIQTPDQYVFCHLAFLEYALNMEHVEEVDLTGFDSDSE